MTFTRFNGQRCGILSTLALFFTLFLSFSNALSPLVIKGNKFFNSQSGEQFYIKGIAYQRSPDDPLLDANQCELDAALMASIGANTIRVYHVDPTADHSACMTAFANHGIYLFVDLSTFTTTIWQGAPHWDQTQLSFFVAVLENFARYENTAGFHIGNEVINDNSGSQAAPYIKAAVADIKLYISKRGFSRPLYVGYSAADIASLRPMLQDYLACSTDALQNIDFWALNAYEWCSDADTFATSGYEALNDFLVKANYNIPVFFSEDGCNVNPPRNFKDMAVIYSKDMTDYWSGAIIYEWIQEQNAYGLITYGSSDDAEGFARSGTPTPLTDFNNLKTAWAAVSPSSISMNAYTPTNAGPSCPAETAGVWNVDPNAAIPTIGLVATKIAVGVSPYDSVVAVVTTGTTAPSAMSFTTASTTSMTLVSSVVVTTSSRPSSTIISTSRTSQAPTTTPSSSQAPTSSSSSPTSSSSPSILLPGSAPTSSSASVTPTTTLTSSSTSSSNQASSSPSSSSSSSTVGTTSTLSTMMTTTAPSTGSTAQQDIASSTTTTSKSGAITNFTIVFGILPYLCSGLAIAYIML